MVVNEIVHFVKIVRHFRWYLFAELFVSAVVVVGRILLLVHLAHQNLHVHAVVVQELRDLQVDVLHLSLYFDNTRRQRDVTRVVAVF